MNNIDIFAEDFQKTATATLYGLRGPTDYGLALIAKVAGGKPWRGGSKCRIYFDSGDQDAKCFAEFDQSNICETGWDFKTYGGDRKALYHQFAKQFGLIVGSEFVEELTETKIYNDLASDFLEAVKAMKESAENSRNPA